MRFQLVLSVALGMLAAAPSIAVVSADGVSKSWKPAEVFEGCGASAEVNSQTCTSHNSVLMQHHSNGWKVVRHVAQLYYSDNSHIVFLLQIDLASLRRVLATAVLQTSHPKNIHITDASQSNGHMLHTTVAFQ